jgi:hypothetical protein
VQEDSTLLDGEGRRLDGAGWTARIGANLRVVRFDRAPTQLLEDGHGVFVSEPAPVLGVALHSASEARAAW